MEFTIKSPEFPSEKDSLFDSEGEFWSNASLYYHFDGWSAYAIGYKEAADVIIQSIIDSKRVFDPLVYPLMQLYRHYLELQFKGLILSSQKLLYKTQSIPKSHNLISLWKVCDALLREVSPGDSEDSLVAITKLIGEFSEVDPFSTGFRYPVDRDGNKSLPALEYIDIQNVAKVMDKIAMLLEGAEAQIDHFRSCMPADEGY